MKSIFGGRYTLFVAKKDIITTKGTVHHKKGEATLGGGNRHIIIDKDIVSIHDWNTGEVIFKGTNYVDCVYKRFSFYAFFTFLYFECKDRWRKKHRTYIQRLAR
jgi:hypothetical protein